MSQRIPVKEGRRGDEVRLRANGNQLKSGGGGRGGKMDKKGRDEQEG